MLIYAYTIGYIVQFYPMALFPLDQSSCSTNIIYSSSSFSHQRWPMVSRWSLSDIKSPQTSRTLLSILADLNNAIPWTVSTHPLISKSSSLCISPLVNVTKGPITIGITDTFIFHSFFFQLPSKVQILIFLFASFQFYSVVCRHR